MKLLHPAEALSILAPYTGRFLNLGEIQEAAEAVTELYRGHGYLSTRVYLTEQDLEDGTITLKVVESAPDTDPDR